MLVLDNVSEASQPQLLVPAHGESVVLITSRTPLQALATAGLVELLEMADEDSMMLLERIIGQRVSDDREAAATIVRCCAGLPLALGVIAGRVRAQPYQTLAEVARRLAESPDVLADIDDRAGTVRATLLSAIVGVREQPRRVLLLLAALDVRDIEPGLVAVVAGTDQDGAARLLEELGEERLLTPRAGGGWRMHDLLRQVASNHAVVEVGEQEIASARAHRVQWLVETAKEHVNDLDGGS